MHLNHRYNRRSDLRVPVQCEVQLQPLNDSEQIHQGMSCDISVSGMQLLADQPYPLNDCVLLDFHCKELGWGPVSSCPASVMWIDPHPIQGRYRLGVKFVKPEC